MDNQIYRVGVYTRLSKEDKNKDESASIETQKAIIKDYVVKKGWQIAKIYVDDGYTGTNFNRPDFQRMKQDIENGVINCVITKDLSRLGRNYLDCGYYLEVFFPENNVRYVALNDGIDTINNSTMDITPFKNIINEMYVKDISMKVKSAIKARFENGKYRCSFAPYGYIKDPNDRNHLLVDENLRDVIKTIFHKYSSGVNISEITRNLTNNKILKPSAYMTKKGVKGQEKKC